MKISKLLIIGLLLSQFVLPQSTFASFIDVPTSYKNYEAIIYLQENGIIKGYSDGTFKPENLVNRAEFLKIIIEGSGIKTDILSSTPFSDINNQAWYAQYVKKAYAEGWIQGYTDGTFRPSQTITKVEALKILGEVQDWQTTTVTTIPFLDTKTTDWFTTYVSFAKENGLLEEEGKLFFPNEEMSRAKISETVYRTIIKGLSPEPIQPIIETTQPTTTEKEIASDFYSNISLNSPIPTTFYKNEVYTIKGTITSGSYKEATVTIVDQEKITEPVLNNHFEISVIFSETGNFLLGILPGNGGTTKVKTISVLPTLPSVQNIETPPSKLSPEINFSNEKTFVNFEKTSSTINKITLTQGTKSVSYFSRQSTSEIPIFYKDFENFSLTSTSYYVESAKISSSSPLVISSEFSKSETKTFSPTYHEFSYISEEVISTPPEKMSSPAKISFTIKPSIEIETTGYITKPDGFVEEIQLPKNLDIYTYSYSPSSSGTYIVEINNSEGVAVVNHPVYIGNKIPLLPDFFDKNQRTYFTDTVSLDTMRDEMLNYINDTRRRYGLVELVLSEDLNTLAQIHSDDMVNNNYFSHTDLNGNTSEDRRKILGISTPVAENMAKEVSIIFAHEGLVRSGGHRKNILEKEWTRVGIGITKTKNDGGYLIVTEEFSTEAITAETLTSMKEDLFATINEERTKNGLSALTLDTTLNDTSKYLNDKVITENTILTNDIFSDALNSFNIGGDSEGFSRTYNLWWTIVDSLLLDEPALTTENWLRMGIDIQTDSDGIINTLIIINK